MGGEVLIEYLVYLLRSAARSFKLRHTTYWRAVPATIYHAKATGGEVETGYRYQFEGGYYSGRDSRDFFWTNSAENHASQFPVGATVVIRVNPSSPEQIAFRDDDQGL